MQTVKIKITRANAPVQTAKTLRDQKKLEAWVTNTITPLIEEWRSTAKDVYPGRVVRCTFLEARFELDIE